MTVDARGWLPVDTSVMREITADYALDPMGIHGLPHWARVLENGRRLSEAEGADPLIVDLFALFHDARRWNEHHDPGHGARGADLARQLRDRLPPLQDAQFRLLCEACDGHTDGRTHPDPTVGACWDADRLDLWRVGMTPRGDLLSTPLARSSEIQVWALERSQMHCVPHFVEALWLPAMDAST
jgi:uncharacterized protein